MHLKKYTIPLLALTLAAALSPAASISASAKTIYAPGVEVPQQNQTGESTTSQSETQNAAASSSTSDGSTTSSQSGETGNSTITATPQGPGAQNSGTVPSNAGSTEQNSAASQSNVIIDQDITAANAAAGPGGDSTAQSTDQSAASAEAALPDNIVISNGRQLDLTKPMIALTYDDGPQTEAGNAIMDVFAQYGQRATFFMVGDRVASRATEVNRMVAEGHEVANHTYEHKYLQKYGAETTVQQVTACNTIITQTCGVTPTLMRLPGGGKNATVLANVGMPVILWNIDTLDWKTRNADKTCAAVIGKVKDGDIVLMHELYSATAAATARIVPELVSEGFQLVTVSELAKYKGYTLEAGKVYYSFPNK